MAKYRKLLVGVLGLAVIVAPQFTGAEDSVVALFDAVVAVLTAFGIYQVPNEPAA